MTLYSSSKLVFTHDRSAHDDAPSYQVWFGLIIIIIIIMYIYHVLINALNAHIIQYINLNIQYSIHT